VPPLGPSRPFFGGDETLGPKGRSGTWGIGVSDVSLVVFDILGRQVAVLVNEKKVPGSYEVRFDGSGLASGVYLYRFTARQTDGGQARQTDGGQAALFIQTRPMILVK